MKVLSVFAISPVAFPEIHRQIFHDESGVLEAVAERPLRDHLRETVPQYRLAPVSVSQSVHVIYLIGPVK